MNTISAVDAVREWKNYKDKPNTNIIIGPDLSGLVDMLSYCLASEHIEQPTRISAIIEKLHQKLWLQNGYRWIVTNSRQLEDEDILLAHSEQYLNDFLTIEQGQQLTEVNCLPNVCNVRQYHELAKATRAAGGTILELVSQVLVCKTALYGIGIVRPPGHHCTVVQSGGNGVINNVAICAKWISKHLNLKVIILDWDIHYCGGTTEILRNGNSLTDDVNLTIDPNIYLIDVFGARGQEIKEYARSKGRKWLPIEYAQNACFINVNEIKFPFKQNNKNEIIGDDVYLVEVWKEIELQINTFGPDVLLISCGLDGALGDDEGFGLTPNGYYQLTQKCKKVMKTKPIIVALEGGYKQHIMAECMCEIVKALC